MLLGLVAFPRPELKKITIRTFTLATLAISPANAAKGTVVSGFASVPKGTNTQILVVGTEGLVLTDACGGVANGGWVSSGNTVGDRVVEETDWDFYSGFEGEPEIVFRRLRADKTDLLFRLWGGYFEVIMGTLWTKCRDVSLDDWPQLLRDWNEVTGYADTFEPCEIEDLGRTAEALKRLAKEDLNEEQGSLEKSWIIVGALIEFLEAAEDAHDPVTIAED